MYNFRDTETVDNNDNVSLLSSESLELPSGYIEHNIDGYETLTVTGRELISKRITESQHEGIDGSIYQNSSYNSRSIVVSYSLTADSSKELIKKYEKLNSLLRSEGLIEFTFADEPDSYYTGILTDVDSIEPGKLNVTGTFTLHSPSPYKYHKPQVINGTDYLNVHIESIEDGEELKPRKLTLEFTGTPGTVHILDTDFDYNYRIRLNYNEVSPGDTITLDFETGILYRNGRRNMNILNWNSDFENIKLYNNTIIYTEPATNLTLEYTALIL